VTRSASTVRVGFIGAGFSACLHAEAYHQVRGVDVALTRVAAARPERAARFAAEFGVSAIAASAEEVFAAADVDVVDLCVPTSLHAPLAIKAARAGKHVIIEKPLTGCFAPSATPRAEMLRRALASSDEILAACREAGVRLCYAENWVYAPPIQRARRLLVAAGGPILRIVGEESHGGTQKTRARSKVAPSPCPLPLGGRAESRRNAPSWPRPPSSDRAKACAGGVR
jgi:predicted dehydrogenase